MADDALAKAAAELNELAALWGMPPEERTAAALKKVALAPLGPPLPPIHCVLFEA
jgi:hypothetical protein